MPNPTIEEFEQTLDTLIDANPHARNKGDEFKVWMKNTFSCDARISYVKEQRQITNRVSEQFRYFAPVVVFVCVPEVKRETLIKYILERVYDNLECVAIIGIPELDHKGDYSYEQLIVFKQSTFAEWAKTFFDNSNQGEDLMHELGISHSSADVNEPADADEPVDESTRLDSGRNIILYGVPGSGKSWTIANDYCTDGSVVNRLVFHPDYTNADFIGQILPVVDKEKQVTYEFTEGPFTTIIKNAYKDPTTKYILIIEEINRGNAPAIFGEAFQLLDRLVESGTIDGVFYKKGTSEYGITNANMADKIYGDPDHKVRIPANLSIIATMNTSDQNVFTLDTAFQRRWHMRLIENNFDYVRDSLVKVKILDTEVTRKKFCTTINELIVKNRSRMASAEDKRLGVYFIHESDIDIENDPLTTPSDGYDTLNDEYHALLQKKRDKTIDDTEKKRLDVVRHSMQKIHLFPEKVIKYLWDDAFKFNPDALFNVQGDNRLESLEDVIKTFVNAEGKERFNIFKPEVRDLLYQ